MSVRQININELREQPSADFEMSADDNTIRATIEYEAPESGWRARVPKMFSPHPDISGLTLRRVRATRVEGDVRKITLSYESLNVKSTDFSFDGYVPKAIYALDVSVSEQPLLTHKRYKDLSDTELSALVQILQGRTRDDDNNNLEDVVTSEMGKEVIAKYKKGRTAWRCPVVIWTEVETVNNLTGFEKVGKIDTPNGNPPAVSAGRNWFFLGAVGRQSSDGKTWSMERKWELSGPEGHDLELYS